MASCDISHQFLTVILIQKPNLILSMFTSTRTVKDPCRRKSDRHASVLSQKLLMTGPAHRQIANSKFIDSYADILQQLSHQGSPNSSVGKESACNTGDPGLIPGSGRHPGEGIGYSFQNSGLENPMDCIVHGVTKSQARPRHFHFHRWISFKKKIVVTDLVPLSS